MGPYMYKINGPALIDKQSNHGKAVSTITTRKFDTAHYEATGELKYLDGGTTVATTLECENAKKMKLEIDSMEKFNAIGGTRAVAREWGVSKSTAHGLKTSLLAKEKKEMPVIKADSVKMGTHSFPIPNIPENYETINKLIQASQAPPEQRNTTTIDDCTIDDIDCLKSCANSFDDDIKCDIIEGSDVGGETNQTGDIDREWEERNEGRWGSRETEDDPGCFGTYEDNRYDSCDSCHSYFKCKDVVREKLEAINGIVEPEPAWNRQRNAESYKSGVYISDDELWQIVEQDLVHLRKRAIEIAVVTANREFDSKIKNLIGGMTV